LGDRRYLRYFQCVANPLTPPTASGPPARTAASIDALVLRWAGLATLAVGVVAVLIGLAVSGAGGAIGAAIAVAIVLVFFSIGQLILGSVLRNNPQMAMTVALMTYLVKLGVLFVFIILFADTTLFDTKVFAATVVVCTIAWTSAEVWVFSRTKVLYVEPGGPS
jgi:ATP synthase protein I